MNIMPTVEYLNYDIVDERDWDTNEDNIFEKAKKENLDSKDYGTFEVKKYEYILDAAEKEGLNWPYSCRSGSCATCSAIVKEGEIEMSGQQILGPNDIKEDIRLTCIGMPKTEKIKIIYNAKNSEYVKQNIVG